jgi:AraC-like DNA-binding protein
VLTATSVIRIGNAGVHSTIVFERAVRATIVRRDKLAFDTRYSPPAAGKLEKVGHVYLIMAGRYAPTVGEPIAGPVAFVLGDDEIERVGAKSRTFRTDGTTVDVVHLRFEHGELAAAVGIAAGPLRLSPACWDIARRVVEAPYAIGELLDVLARDGVTHGTAKIHDEPERYRRFWDALRPLYETYGGTVSLKQLAAALDMSMRQVGRDAKDIAKTFGFGSGYRDALLILRLRMAVLLLSGPDSSVAEVASAVGYGSPIAMARAFRDARLPAPSAVQAAVRSE